LSEILSGTIYANQRFFEGSVEFGTDGAIELHEHAIRDGSRLILPVAVNCHTHVGDYCLRGKIDLRRKLEDIVRPPDGLKHRLLSETDEDTIISGISSAISEMKRNGIRVFIDFREGGIQGVGMLRKALARSEGIDAIVLSRPKSLEYNDAEIDQLLEVSDGIGLSAVSDWRYDDILAIAQHVKSKGKIFSLHASESRREDIGKILDLSPDFLVHMALANDDDLVACHEMGIPIVVCPRSNSLFNIRLDITRMIDAGITVCLGTDNAMFHSLSVIDEMRAAYRLRSNSRQLTVEEVFRLAFDNPQKIINDKSRISFIEGARPLLMVVEARGRMTPERLLGADIDYTIRLIEENEQS